MSANMCLACWQNYHHERSLSSDYWRGVAGYHSLTPSLNNKYQNKVLEKYRLLSEVLGG